MLVYVPWDAVKYETSSAIERIFLKPSDREVHLLMLRLIFIRTNRGESKRS
jgi:hypothetical protein